MNWTEIGITIGTVLAILWGVYKGWRSGQKQERVREVVDAAPSSIQPAMEHNSRDSAVGSLRLISQIAEWYEGLRDEHDVLQRQFGELNTRFMSVERMNEGQLKRIRELEQQLQAVHAELDHLRRQLETTTTERDQLQARVLELEARVRDLEAELERAKKGAS